MLHVRSGLSVTNATTLLVKAVSLVTCARRV